MKTSIQNPFSGGLAAYTQLAKDNSAVNQLANGISGLGKTIASQDLQSQLANGADPRSQAMQALAMQGNEATRTGMQNLVSNNLAQDRFGQQVSQDQLAQENYNKNFDYTKGQDIATADAKVLASDTLFEREQKKAAAQHRYALSERQDADSGTALRQEQQNKFTSKENKLKNEAVMQAARLKTMTDLRKENAKPSIIEKAIQKKAGEDINALIGRTDKEIIQSLEQGLTDENNVEDVNLGSAEEKKYINMTKAFLASNPSAEDLKLFRSMTPKQRLDSLLAKEGKVTQDQNWAMRNLVPQWLGGSDIKFVDQRIK